jgi:restriction endonuclease S subunit
MDGWEGRVREKGRKDSNAKILPINSVLMALNGQGKTRGTVALLRVEATCNQSVISINPKDKGQLKSEFLYYILKGMYQDVRDLTGDNQRSGLSMSIIKNIQIPLAPIEIQEQFVQEFKEEQKYIESVKSIARRFEDKIKSKIAEIWDGK